tara:strand:+ start:11613 stop:11774 length:162 start_codon:yes stop_codon:yes gene_type:complete
MTTEKERLKDDRILEAGADVNFKNDLNETALTIAKEYWRDEVVELLENHINNN